MLTAICNAPVMLSVPAQNIRFYRVPTLTWEGTKVNGARQEKSTLEFQSDELLPENIYIGFVITTTSGKQYLIGSREPKYPVITYNETTGTPDGDAALRTYKITHIAQKSVLPCFL